MPRRLSQRAEEAAAKKDLRTAFIHLKRALEIDPDSPEATRATARLVQDEGDPSALPWWQRAVELDPNYPGIHLELAAAALIFGNLGVAESALQAVPAAERKSSSYLINQAGLLFALGKRPEALAKYLEAAALEPGNPVHRFNVANARLSLGTADERTKAVAELEGLAAQPSRVSLLAVRSLRDNLGGVGDLRTGLRWARQARQHENASLTDRVALLALLQKLEPGEAEKELQALQVEVAGRPVAVGQLASWMASNGQAVAALAWAEKLGPEILRQPEPSLGFARCRYVLADWPALERWTNREGVHWGMLEHLRLALLARARAGKEGSPNAVNSLWRLAVVETGRRPARLQALADLAREWNWTEAENDVLWRLADLGGAPARLALPRLYRKYDQARDNRRLQQVFQRMSEADPKNVFLRDMYVWTALMIGAARDTHVSAAEQSARRPEAGPAERLTLAYLRLVERKPAEAEKLLQEAAVGPSAPLLQRIRASVVQSRLRGQPPEPPLLKPEEVALLPEEEQSILLRRSWQK
ncbi:MAG: hypothetical protein JSR82_09750 [Verrucomicrobia bacterium]|nr:hypothetical protein [Verrucomicrobiota bacterium]